MFPCHQKATYDQRKCEAEELTSICSHFSLLSSSLLLLFAPFYFPILASSTYYICTHICIYMYINYFFTGFWCARSQRFLAVPYLTCCWFFKLLKQKVYSSFILCSTLKAFRQRDRCLDVLKRQRYL